MEPKAARRRAIGRPTPHHRVASAMEGIAHVGLPTKLIGSWPKARKMGAIRPRSVDRTIVQTSVTTVTEKTEDMKKIERQMARMRPPPPTASARARASTVMVD